MKINILAILLAAALVSSVLALFRLAHEQGEDDARRAALANNLAQSQAVINELRQLEANARAVLADVRAADKQRHAEGERRREKIRTELANDDCARAAMPAAVAEQLQKRARAAGRAAAASSGPGKSDAADTSSAAGAAGNMGQSGDVGR